MFGNITGCLLKPLDPQAVYTCIIGKYGTEPSSLPSVNRFCAHLLGSTAVTTALEQGADIGKRNGSVMPMFQQSTSMTEEMQA